MTALPPVAWTAELTGVRDVALEGTADLEYWRRRLEPEGLVPLEREGRARLGILAGDLRFKGVRFRELSLCALVQRADGMAGEGAFLLQAWNTVRFFAFIERVVFRTPYTHAPVEVGLEPATLRVERGGQACFTAAMGADGPGRAPLGRGELAWSGPVYLPERPGSRAAPERRRVFFTRIGGSVVTHVFDPERDTFVLDPPPAGEGLDLLVASGFRPLEWRVGADRSHAKSKTYRRGAVPGGA